MIPREVLLSDGSLVTIRGAMVSDLEQIIRIFKLIAHEKTHFVVERVEVHMDEEKRNIRRSRGRNGLIAVAVNQKGHVVGFVNVIRSRRAKSRHVADIDSIGILPRYRGMGLGRELTREAIHWAHRSGIKKLSLGVFSSNIAALKLYRSMRFVLDGVIRRQYRIRNRYVDNINLAFWP